MHNRRNKTHTYSNGHTHDDDYDDGDDNDDDSKCKCARWSTQHRRCLSFTASVLFTPRSGCRRSRRRCDETARRQSATLCTQSRKRVCRVCPEQTQAAAATTSHSTHCVVRNPAHAQTHMLRLCASEHNANAKANTNVSYNVSVCVWIWIENQHTQ